MNLIVCAPVALFAQENLEAVKGNQMPAAFRAPGLARALVKAIYLTKHTPVSLDFEHQPAHFRVLDPDLSQFALGDRAEVRERFSHGNILDIKTVFLHAPGKPSSTPDARHALNTPTYCRETGLRIGVCPCPLCSKSQKDQQQ